MLRAIIAIIALGSLSFSGALCAAAKEVGETDEALFQLVERVRERHLGRDSRADVRMSLFAPDGDLRERSLELRYYQGEDARKSIMRIKSPREERDTTFLSYSYAAGVVDDQWLYLPSLRRTRQIASSRRVGAFIGSDFSYADIERIDPSAYSYTLLGEERWQGERLLHISAVPFDEAYARRMGYSRSEWWIEPRQAIMIKQLNFDLNGLPLREIKVEELKAIDGIVTATRVRADNLQERSYTLMEVDAVEYNKGLSESSFNSRRLQYLR